MTKKYNVNLSYERLANTFDFEVLERSKEKAIEHIKRTSDSWWGNIHGKATITATLDKGEAA